MNDKLTVLKKQQAVTTAFLKPQTWAAIAANIKMHLPFYNKNNKMVVKFNNNTLTEEMKKQAPKKVIYRINAYLIKTSLPSLSFARHKLYQIEILPYKQ